MYVGIIWHHRPILCFSIDYKCIINGFRYDPTLILYIVTTKKVAKTMIVLSFFL